MFAFYVLPFAWYRYVSSFVNYIVYYIILNVRCLYEKIACKGMWYQNDELVLRLGLEVDLVFKQSSICRERRWYAHAWPRRQFVIISRSRPFASDFHVASDAKKVMRRLRMRQLQAPWRCGCGEIGETAVGGHDFWRRSIRSRGCRSVWRHWRQQQTSVANVACRRSRITVKQHCSVGLRQLLIANLSMYIL